jgi:hypothetical protein
VRYVRERRQTRCRTSPSPAVRQLPALVGIQVEALERVVGEQQAAVEVDPSASDATTAEPAIPTDVSSMQPRKVLNRARALARASRARRDPAALGELDVDPATTPPSASRSSGDTALVGDDRDRRALLEPAEVAIGARRERLLDELDAERRQLRQQRDRVVARPAGVGVDPDRAVEHVADRPSVARSAGRRT